MTAPSCDDNTFTHLFETYGATETARKLGISERSVYKRRRSLERSYVTRLQSPREKDNQKLPFSIEPVEFEGPVVIAGDCHFWPNVYTDAFWIMLQVIREIKPVAFVLNGDAFDGAQISRHSRIGWDQRPSVAEELQACKSCLDMIDVPQKFWNWGNHDLRFDTFLSSRVGEFVGVKGTSLRDHFPEWTFQWGLMVNDSCVIKHRFKGGTHAAHNNTLWAGKSMVTGHTHRLQVVRFSDYSGSRYGAESGTLADIYSSAMDYTEGAPLNQQPGFLVAYFEKGDHWIEAVEVKRNGTAWFAGKKWTP